eukprot:31266-Pelagococcus_subviridis.AAC.8
MQRRRVLVLFALFSFRLPPSAPPPPSVHHVLSEIQRSATYVSALNPTSIANSAHTCTLTSPSVRSTNVKSPASAIEHLPSAFATTTAPSSRRSKGGVDRDVVRDADEAPVRVLDLQKHRVRVVHEGNLLRPSEPRRRLVEVETAGEHGGQHDHARERLRRLDHLHRGAYEKPHARRDQGQQHHGQDVRDERDRRRSERGEPVRDWQEQTRDEEVQRDVRERPREEVGGHSEHAAEAFLDDDRALVREREYRAEDGEESVEEDDEE